MLRNRQRFIDARDEKFDDEIQGLRKRSEDLNTALLSQKAFFSEHQIPQKVERHKFTQNLSNFLKSTNSDANNKNGIEGDLDEVIDDEFLKIEE